MTHVYQKRSVRTPYNLARSFLNETVARSADEQTRLTVNLTFPVRTGRVGSSLEHEVMATVSRATDPMHLDQPWHVHWTPKGGSPYPDFNGELTVRADEDWVRSFLELDGHYRPPLGIAGAALDAVVGSLIAASTALELLDRIRKQIEERYQRDEAAKPHG